MNTTEDSDFRSAHGSGDHWGLVTKACLDGLLPLPKGANLGLLYVTETFAGDLPSILTFLRETTDIDQWVGAVAHGICATGIEYLTPDLAAGGAISVLVGRFEPESFRVFSSLVLDEAWLARHPAVVGLVHADPLNPGLGGLIARLVEDSHAYLLGGLTSSEGGELHVAGSVTGGGVSGVLFDSALITSVGLTQGCTPIGPPHLVTEGGDGVVMSLDGMRALDVLKEEGGALIARDLKKAAGFIHVALPVTGSDRNDDYLVRSLAGIDPRQGWLAVGEDLQPGDRMMFVRRDPNTAQTDLRRMVRDAGARAQEGGRTIKAGIYISCVARGAHMFGPGNRELATIREELGDFPLIGFFANGEICCDRLYGYTGVLALIG